MIRNKKKSLCIHLILALGLTLNCHVSAKQSEDYQNTMTAYQYVLEDHPRLKFMLLDICPNGIPTLVTLDETVTEWGYSFWLKDTDSAYRADDVNSASNLIGYYPGTGVYVVANDDDYETYYYLPDCTQYEDHSFSDFYSSMVTPIGGYRKHDIQVYNDIEKAGYTWYGFYEPGHAEEFTEKAQAAGIISEDEFMQELAQYTNDVKREDIPDEWHENTEENRTKYIK